MCFEYKFSILHQITNQIVFKQKMHTNGAETNAENGLRVNVEHFFSSVR